MALDYSGKYAKALDPYESTNGTDTLFALGWAYKGDNDKDGHDDGYNCLYRIWTSKWNGQWFVDEIGKITGGKDGVLPYDGFTVYTLVQPDGTETVYDVEKN